MFENSEKWPDYSLKPVSVISAWCSVVINWLGIYFYNVCVSHLGYSFIEPLQNN